MKKNIFKFSLILFTLFLSAFSLSCKSDFNEDIMYETVGNDLEKTPPADISQFSMSTASKTVKLSWLNPTDKDFYGIKIEVSSSSKDVVPPDDITLMDDDQEKIPTEYTFYNLLNDVEYTFNISTFDKNLNFSSGKSLSTTPSANLSEYAVTGAVAIAGDQYVTLKWNNTSFTSFYGIQIKVTPSESSGKDPILLRNSNPDEIPTEYTFYNLSNGTNYQFTIQEFDTELNLSNAYTVQGTPEKDSNTMVVSDFAAVTADSKIYLKWTNPNSDNFYGVQISASSSYSEAGLGTLTNTIYYLGDKIPTELEVDNLVNDYTYNFTIYALDRKLNLSSKPLSISQTPRKDTHTMVVSNFKAISKDSSIILKWDNPDNPNFYGLRISTYTADPELSLGTMEKPVYFLGNDIPNQLIVNNLVNENTYNFVIYVLDKNLNLSSKQETTSSTPSKGINTLRVSNLRVNSADGELTLQWSNPIDEDFYGLQISMSSENGSLGSLATPIYFLDANIPTSYTVTGLTNEARYDFNISTIDVNLSVSPSSVPITGYPAKNIIGNVRNLSHTSGDTFVVLNWQNPDATDFYGVKIVYYPNENESQAKQISFMKDSLSQIPTSCKISELENGTTYNVYIYSINTDLYESSPLETSVKPSKDVNGMQVSSLFANTSNNKIDLSWINPSNQENFYGIMIESTPAQGNLTVPVYFLNSDKTKIPFSYTVTGLTNGTTYTLKVYTIDKKMNLSTGVSTSGKPTASENQVEVENLNTLTYSQQVKLSWTNPSSSDLSSISKYEITMSPPKVGETGIIDISPTSINPTITFPNEYLISGLTNDVSYSFTLRTVDNAGNKSIGTSVYATPNVGNSGLNSNKDLFGYKKSYKAYDFGYCTQPVQKIFSFVSSTTMDLTNSTLTKESGKGSISVTYDKNTVQNNEDFKLTVTYTPPTYTDDDSASWDEFTYKIAGEDSNAIKFIGSNFPQPKNIKNNKLGLWLRTDLITTDDMKGNYVINLPDYSGNGYDAKCSDTTGTYAPYYQESYSTFNNNPAIDFYPSSNNNKSTSQLISLGTNGKPIISSNNGISAFVVFHTTSPHSTQNIISTNYGSSFPTLIIHARYYNPSGFYVSGDYKTGLGLKGSGLAGTYRYPCISNSTTDKDNRMMVIGAPASASGQNIEKKLNPDEKVGSKALNVCMIYDASKDADRHDFGFNSNIFMYVNGEERLLSYIWGNDSNFTSAKLNDTLIDGITTNGSYGKPWGDGKGHRYGELTDVIHPESISQDLTEWKTAALNADSIGRKYDRAYTYTPSCKTSQQMIGGSGATANSDYFQNYISTDIWRNGNINSLTVGPDFVTNSNSYCQFAEVILFEGVLSADDIDSVNNYIKYRYNIQKISTNTADACYQDVN